MKLTVLFTGYGAATLIWNLQKNNIACSLIIGHLFGNFILESTGKAL